MRALRPMRLCGLLLAFLVAVPIGSFAAPATQIVGIRVEQQPNGGSIVAIQFNGDVPKYTPVGAGTAQLTIVVPGVSPGPLVPPTVQGAGVITNAAVTQSNGNTSIFVRFSGPQQVQVRGFGTVLIVDVPPGENPTGFGGLNQLPHTSAPATGTVTEVIALKYADISEIAGVLVQGSNVASNDTFSPIQTNIGTSQLSGTFGGVTGGFGQTTAQQSFGTGGFGQASSSLAQRLNDNIAVDRRLNAIILTGTPDAIAEYKATIEKIDVPVPSVILETEIVELNETAAQNIGIDFAPGGSGIVISGAPNGTSSTGGTTDGVTIRTGSVPQGQISLAANLYAQVSNGNGRVIAKPRILAQSGQQASILTGDAIPILTSVVVTGSSALTSQQVNYVNVGVNLQILPRVSSDGNVTSHIYSEVSSVTQYVAGIPQISQRTASTLATVKDGESFVIGGLLQDAEIKNLVKLPFIGDLPLLGVFFRHLTTSRTQSNLYIVVTPHIVGHAGRPPSAQPYIPRPDVPVFTPPPGGAAPAPSASP